MRVVNSLWNRYRNWFVPNVRASGYTRMYYTINTYVLYIILLPHSSIKICTLIENFNRKKDHMFISSDCTIWNRVWTPGNISDNPGFFYVYPTNKHFTSKIILFFGDNLSCVWPRYILIVNSHFSCYIYVLIMSNNIGLYFILYLIWDGIAQNARFVISKEGCLETIFKCS